MGYKLLGFVVWQGSKWYLRRRMSGFRRKAAIAGIAGIVVIVIAGVIAAGRQPTNQ
jgi:hypothetical protein